MELAAFKPLANHVHFDEFNLWVDLLDGRSLSVPLDYFPRLLNATSEQRQNFIISGGGVGLHWEEIDEDISVENLLLGIPDTTRLKKASRS
ncbi:MAG: DUF2442 domain-containing protein [Candidatus Hydrogenedentes bacterium]|nr:DUF2442 domain-containing protein [Candidatus Hydrogenedentota bacterium]